MKKIEIKGIYVISNDVSLINEALKGGVKIVQYREKHLDIAAKLLNARRIKNLCEEHDATLIINDDVSLAIECDADGVHVGQFDGDLTLLRSMMPDKILGVSCYNSVDRAIYAQEKKVDYVAFGRFFPSVTKPNAIKTELEVLMKAKKTLSIPVVAIGGINLKNLPQVITSGADSVAIINSIFSQPDVVGVSKRFVNLFNKLTNSPLPQHSTS